jgi:hypothetical protein
MTDSTGHRDPNELAEALSASWDARVAGEATDDAGAAEGLVDVVGRLHASDTTPALLPGQRRQIWEAIMATAVISADPPRHASRVHPSANGHAPGLVFPPSAAPLRWSPATARPWWILAQLATAALLLVTLGLGYLTFGPGRQGERVPALPALVAPATSTPGESLLETVFATTLPAAQITSAGDLNTFLLTHAVLAADTRVPIQGPIAGPLIIHVQQGKLTLRVDGPLQLFPGSDGGANTNGAEAVPPGTEVILDPGDTAVYAYDLPAALANRGTTPVHLVLGGYLAGLVPGALADLTFIDYAEQYPVPALPPGPVRATLMRAVVPAKEAVPAPPLGTLIRAVGAEGEVSIGEGSDGAIRNVNSEPIVIYLLTLEPGGDASTMLTPRSDAARSSSATPPKSSDGQEDGTRVETPGSTVVNRAMGGGEPED